MEGFLLVDKPHGITSHDVVQQVRRMAGLRRVGHAGTLDPMATGVLVTALGKATRLNEYLLGSRKAYTATLQLGGDTPSHDAETELSASYPTDHLTQAMFDAVLPRFRGDIMQTPPAYSAIKRDGQRSYKRARRGEAVTLDPRPVTIYSLELIDWQPPSATIAVVCSSGTYIRALAHDIGRALDNGAYLTALRRTVAGPFSLADCQPLDDLKAAFAAGDGAKYITPAGAALADWPLVTVDAATQQQLVYGQAIVTDHDAAAGTLARACTADGTLVAVIRAVDDTGVWRPVKVLA